MGDLGEKLNSSISSTRVCSPILTTQSSAVGLLFHSLFCSFFLFLRANFCFYCISSFRVASQVFHRAICPRLPPHPALQLSCTCTALWVVPTCVPWLCMFLGRGMVPGIQQATWRRQSGTQPFTNAQVSVQLQVMTAAKKGRRCDGAQTGWG